MDIQPQISPPNELDLQDAPDRTGGFSGLLVLGLLITAAVSTVVSQTLSDLDEQIIAASIGFAALALACLFGFSRRHPLRTLFDLRLGAWFFGYASVAFGLATITFLDPTTVNMEVPLSSIPGTMLLLSLSFLCAAIGYQARAIPGLFGVPVRAMRRFLEGKRTFATRSVLALYGVFLLGVLADAATVALTGQYGYLGDSALTSPDSAAWYVQPLNIVSGLKLAAVVGLALIAAKPGARGTMRILGPAVLAAVLLGVLTGTKESFIDVVLAVVIPWVVVRKRFPIVWVIAASLIFVFVITPFVTHLREDVRGSKVLSVQDAISLALTQLVSPETYARLTESSDSGMQIASRVRLIDNLAVIQAKTPSTFAFRDPMEIALAPVTGLIPRAVWPDKPVRLGGYDFYRMYYKGRTESSSAITPQGSLYMYGGSAVLLLGMFFIGVVIRALDDSLESMASPHSAMLLVFLSTVIIKEEMDIPEFLASIPVWLITWILAVFLVFRSGPQVERLAARRSRALIQ